MQDLRFALRVLVKDRWFTTATVLALALGMGANTIVFTIVNGWNLQDLPVEDGDKIVAVATQDAQGRRRGASHLDFLDWRRASRSLAGVAAHASGNMTVAVEGRPAERLAGTFISANGFSVLRERPFIGRDFRPEDDRPGALPVAIVGHSVWIERFGGDPSVVGRTLRINGAATTVVGVMREGFRFPVQSEIWQPLALKPGLAAEARDVRAVGVFGRLADDVTISQAGAEFTALAAALEKQYPATNRDIRAIVMSFTDSYFGSLTEGPPFILMIAVGVVLLIACANAANLLLARASYRTREIALRRALGASRWRVVRQLLVESLLLAMLAGVCGLLLAWPVVRVIAAETADFNLPYWARLTFDARVFAYVAAVCVATTLLFGLAPAWKLSRARAAETLTAAARSMSGGRPSRRLTSGLLVAELALSVILLTSAGLLIRSARVLSDADRLIVASNVLTGSLLLPETRYGTPEQKRALYDQLEERLRSIPSIASASIATGLPFLGGQAREVAIDDDGRPEPSLRPVATIAIGAAYHETLGLSMVRGRSFQLDDGLPGRETAIVNERFVAVHMPGQDPLGRRIRVAAPANQASPPTRFTIVGVAPSIRHSPTRDPQPAVYLPLRADPSSNIALLVRARGDGATLTAIREELRKLDSDLPLYNVSTLERRSEQSRFTHRAMSMLLGFFAAIALTLSAMGLYAVIAYAVSQRTSEIGIRMALGARRSQVTWLFLRESLVRLGLGVALGIGGAIAAGRLLAGVLVRTSALDPATFGGVVALLSIVALIAAVVPARRASALDPAVALRHD